MAASFVQAGQGPGGTTSDAVTLGSSTPVGNLILAFIDWSDTIAFTSISDDIGNTYTQIGSENNGNSIASRAYWAKNATAGVRTITVNAGAGSTFMDLTIEEITGQNSTPIDSSNSSHPAASQNPTLDDVSVADNVLLVAWGVATSGTSTVSTAGFSASRIAAGAHIIADKLISPPADTTVTYHNTGSPNWHLWLVGIAPPSVSRSHLFTLLGIGT